MVREKGKNMKYFIDTASLGHLREAMAWGIFSGVTTNPVLLSKESANYAGLAQKILATIPEHWEVSLPVKSDSPEGMISQARVLAEWGKQIRVKLPATIPGLKAASQLIGDIPLNLTIVKSPAQAMLCMGLLEHPDSGDMVISVFCGRLRQVGYDWQEVITTLTNTHSKARILAASIKTPADISDAIKAGADIITAPMDVYQAAMSSSLVNDDAALFDRAFDEEGLQVPGAMRVGD